MSGYVSYLNQEPKDSSICLKCPVAKGRLAKCCEHQPFVPSYQVGKIINSGVLSAKDLLAKKTYSCSPLGLLPLYDPYKGYSGSQPCSFFVSESRTCKIWPFTGPECSSYFCKDIFGVKEYNEYFKTSDQRLQFDLLVTQMMGLELSIEWSLLDLGSQHLGRLAKKIVTNDSFGKWSLWHRQNPDFLNYYYQSCADLFDNKQLIQGWVDQELTLTEKSGLDKSIPST